MQPAEPKVPTLTVLSHPDPSRVGERALLWDSALSGGEALLARLQLDFAMPGGGPGRPLEDPYISRRPIRFTAARFGGIRVDCAESGTRVVANEDWISEDRVFLGVEVERGVVLILSERVSLLLHNLELVDLDAGAGDGLPRFGLVGESSPMLRVRRRIRRLVQDPDPALIHGGIGTGKKVAARAIHGAGDHHSGPCVMADLSADGCQIADLVARAAGGTLILDSVESLSHDVQNELLRVIDRGGASDPRLVMVAGLSRRGSGQRRSSPGPLFDRWAERAIEMPALNQRRDDFGRLLFHFLEAELSRLGAAEQLRDPGPYAPPWLPAHLVARLASYDWPRNVRQLKCVVRELARRHHQQDHAEVGGELEALLEGTAESSDWRWPEEAESRVEARDAADVSERELLTALRAHQWQAEPAAEELGVSPEALFAMIEDLSARSERRKRARRSS